jgi:hypothetical protein
MVYGDNFYKLVHKKLDYGVWRLVYKYGDYLWR